MQAQAETMLPTRFGDMRIKVYANGEGVESQAIIAGTLDGQDEVTVRVHSACFTAEVLGSLKCDCKHQLDFALQYISEKGGVVVYLPQEGRGIGLSNKIRAYALQEQGYDTVDANRALGLPVDARSYHDAAFILRDLGIQRIRLITNNPLKISALNALGISVQGRIPVPFVATEHSLGYLEAKRTRMGHLPGPVESPDHPPGPAQFAPEAKQPGNARTRPFVHLNLALNSRGQTASESGKSIPLSCPRDWCRVHELRERYSAVAVGARTWQLDKPRLTAREEYLARVPRRQPDRIIFAGRTPCVVEPDQRRTFVIGQLPQPDGIIQIATVEHGLNAPLADLYRHGVESMLVEGGLMLLRSFLREGFVDRLTVYVRTDCVTTATRAIRSTIPELATDGTQVDRFGLGVLVTSGDLSAT